jgi:hypothetical protein
LFSISNNFFFILIQPAKPQSHQPVSIILWQGIINQILFEPFAHATALTAFSFHILFANSKYEQVSQYGIFNNSSQTCF